MKNKENKDKIGTNLNNKILINNDKKDIVMELYCKLYNKGLLSKIEKYSTSDYVVKFMVKNKKLPKDWKNWIPAWHGTEFKYLESIVINGLKYQKIAICGKCGLAKYKVVE